MFRTEKSSGKSTSIFWLTLGISCDIFGIIHPYLHLSVGEKLQLKAFATYDCIMLYEKLLWIILSCFMESYNDVIAEDAKCSITRKKKTMTTNVSSCNHLDVDVLRLPTLVRNQADTLFDKRTSLKYLTDTYRATVDSHITTVRRLMLRGDLMSFEDKKTERPMAIL